MKLKIYQPVQASEKVTFLQISEQDDGVVHVHAVDMEGRSVPSGHLFSLSDSGILRFYKVNESLGFELDGDGRIRILG